MKKQSWFALFVWFLLLLCPQSVQTAAWREMLHTLTVQIRLPDGAAARGVTVTIRSTPDDLVAAPPCRIPASGRCIFRLPPNLYTVALPAAYRLDSVTAVELGHAGLSHLGVYLTGDYLLGLVLADATGEGVGETIMIDLDPDEPQPLPRLPAAAPLATTAPRPTTEAAPTPLLVIPPPLPTAVLAAPAVEPPSVWRPSPLLILLLFAAVTGVLIMISRRLARQEDRG